MGNRVQALPWLSSPTAYFLCNNGMRRRCPRSLPNKACHRHGACPGMGGWPLRKTDPASSAYHSYGLVMLPSTALVKQILTRTSGYLSTVASHSLQPYRGCAWATASAAWDAMSSTISTSPTANPGAASSKPAPTPPKSIATNTNPSADGPAPASRFGIFLSSSTEPFQPMERRWRVTRSVLEAMVDLPPDFLILQSHSHHVADYLDLYPLLAERCELRIHMSIESDRDGCRDCRHRRAASQTSSKRPRLFARRDRVVITVSPLLPIADPIHFCEPHRSGGCGGH